MAEKIRDYGKLAADIVETLGKENVTGATYCATRFRLILKDHPTKEQDDKISKMPAVIKTQEVSGQYQIVIGTHAKDVYEAAVPLLGLKEEDMVRPKQNIFLSMAGTMSGTIMKFCYVLAACGLIQGVLIIIRMFAPAFTDTPIDQVISMISWTPFTFMPVLIGVSAAQFFRCNPYIAVTCCLALTNPTWAGGVMNLFPPMFQTAYTSTVIPSIVMVWVLSKLERRVSKAIPDVASPFLTPFVCCVVMVLATLFIIGPIVQFLTGAVASGYNWLHSHATPVAAIVAGFFWQILVIFGIHHGVGALSLANFNTGAGGPGFDTFQALITCAVIAQAAACFGVFFKTKDKEIKSIAISAGLTGVFGITEPAIFGVNLRLKKPFFIACASAAVGSLVVSFFGSANFIYAGLTGILSTPNAVAPAVGSTQYNALPAATQQMIANGQFANSFIGMLVGAGITIVLTIVLILILGCDEKEKA